MSPGSLLGKAGRSSCFRESGRAEIMAAATFVASPERTIVLIVAHWGQGIWGEYQQRGLLSPQSLPLGTLFRQSREAAVVPGGGERSDGHQ